MNQASSVSFLMYFSEKMRFSFLKNIALRHLAKKKSFIFVWDGSVNCVNIKLMLNAIVCFKPLSALLFVFEHWEWFLPFLFIFMSRIYIYNQFNSSYVQYLRAFVDRFCAEKWLHNHHRQRASPLDAFSYEWLDSTIERMIYHRFDNYVVSRLYEHKYAFSCRFFDEIVSHSTDMEMVLYQSESVNVSIGLMIVWIFCHIYDRHKPSLSGRDFVLPMSDDGDCRIEEIRIDFD